MANFATFAYKILTSPPPPPKKKKLDEFNFRPAQYCIEEATLKTKQPIRFQDFLKVTTQIAGK